MDCAQHNENPTTVVFGSSAVGQDYCGRKLYKQQNAISWDWARSHASQNITLSQ